MSNTNTINGFSNIIGTSEAMRKVFRTITKIAPGDANVLICGESGVGKELVARSIHNHSRRSGFPLIPINCAALPAPLFESELFGYKKGAFTGAFQSKPGLAELANGGILFLDEICELPQNLQVKLLRMLEDHKIRPIGAREETSVNIRVFSATNRDVRSAVESGALREDLFFRINTIQIHVPPLRERGGDILLLIDHTIKRLNEKYNRGIETLEPAALALLTSYDWPGNVRELQNVIERAFYLATAPQIVVADLPSNLTQQSAAGLPKSWQDMSYKAAKDMVLEAFEREYLEYQLERHDWNISRTAVACNIDRRTIHRLINKFNLRLQS